MFVLIWVWKSKLLIYLSRFPLSLSSLYTTATVNKYDCENSWCCYNLVVMRWTSKSISFPKQKFQHWKQSRKKISSKKESKPTVVKECKESSILSQNRIPTISSGSTHHYYIKSHYIHLGVCPSCSSTFKIQVNTFKIVFCLNATTITSSHRKIWDFSSL